MAKETHEQQPPKLVSDTSIDATVTSAADARVHRVVGRIITIEDLHQHVLDLAADLRIKWTDRPPEADPEVRTVHLRPNQTALTPLLCMRLGTSAKADLTMC
jgi:hypothetical protein